VSVRALTYAVNGHRCIDCPVCPPGNPQAVRVDRVRDRLRFTPYCGHDEAAVAAMVDADRILAELVGVDANGGDPEEETAAEKLAVLLGLSKAGLAITGGRVVGRGRDASADLYLSDGSTLTFDSLGDMANSARLATQLVACTGVVRTFKTPEALRAIALTRQLAEHEETLTGDQIAIDWGCSYLQVAEVWDVDLGDQAARWEAFERIAARDPYALARERGISLDAAGLVLRDVDGTRLVRCGWFRGAIRAQDSSISPAQLAHRMKRVGWGRRRVKATRPKFRETRLWEFYAVRADWQVNE
jgi:hypothetical protein